MFNKIFIANRGAIARRVIRACRELGIESVVVYAQADAGLPYLEEADQAIALCGDHADQTYLNQSVLLNALKCSGADALHPGYGFLAENAAFAEAVTAAGVTFIGPDAVQISRLGDKAQARQLIADAGIPVLPGSPLLDGLASARSEAKALGYPLMLKPAGGGGGIGIRRLENDDDLNQAFARSQRLAVHAFNDPRLYLEACWRQPRHIEIQILADKSGGAMHVFERDCSLQRRHQKIIEEAPAPNLPRVEIQPWLERAASAMSSLGYDNAGTVEMLRSAEGNYAFLEINTRIQVEHGVTELVTGLDLVQEQIRLAAGGQLPAAPVLNGYAIEARILAVNPATGFASTGQLRTFRPPRMRFVRVETGYCEGATVSPFYDGLLAKVLAWGTTREQAIGRLLVGLRAFEIRGVVTNLSSLRDILRQPWFLAAQLHTESVSE